jgi:Fe-S cluster biogenesis protein NfuA
MLCRGCMVSAVTFQKKKKEGLKDNRRNDEDKF